jgi:hypothetical protein
MDSTIDTTTAKQGIVRSIDYGVDFQCGDISLNYFDHFSISSAIKCLLIILMHLY